jgi:type IV secretion system protein VirB6
VIDNISPIYYLEGEIDRALGVYVTSASANLAAGLGVFAALGLTIYFMVLGLAVARGDVQQPMSKVVKDSLSMVIIAVIGIGAGVYQQQVVGAVYGVLEFLVSKMTSGGARTVGQAISMIFATDSGSVVVDGKPVSVDNALWVIALQNSNSLGIPQLTYMFANFCVWIATVVVSVLCVLPWLLSKVGIAIGLAVGPLFIMLGMFPQTRNYFASWLSNVLGNVFTGMLVATICSLMPTVFITILTKSLAGAGTDSYSPMAMGLGMLIVGIGLGFAALQVSQMGAQLAGGGMAMDSKGLAGAVVQSLIFSRAKGGSTDKGSTGATNSVESSPSYGFGHQKGQQARQRVGQILSGISKRGGK